MKLTVVFFAIFRKCVTAVPVHGINNVKRCGLFSLRYELNFCVCVCVCVVCVWCVYSACVCVCVNIYIYIYIYIYIVKIAQGVQKAILLLQSAVKHRLRTKYQCLCQLQNHAQRLEKRLTPSSKSFGVLARCRLTY